MYDMQWGPNFVTFRMAGPMEDDASLHSELTSHRSPYSGSQFPR
jgi:hypothetical protein